MQIELVDEALKLNPHIKPPPPSVHSFANPSESYWHIGKRIAITFGSEDKSSQ